MTRNHQLTPAEHRVIRHCRTPLLTQRWLRSLRYNWERDGATLRSFRGVVRSGAAHCLEAALAAAAVMERHGYPPLLLDLESRDCLDHVLFAFRANGRWGAVAGSRDVGLWGRKPVFRSVEALARSYYDPYIDLTGRITAYALVDLRDLGSYDWRFSTRNVWKVLQFLIDARHRPMPTSYRRYIRLRRQYREFIKTHDPRDTPFTLGRKHWM